MTVVLGTPQPGGSIYLETGIVAMGNDHLTLPSWEHSPGWQEELNSTQNGTEQK